MDVLEVLGVGVVVVDMVVVGCGVVVGVGTPKVVINTKVLY